VDSIWDLGRPLLGTEAGKVGAVQPCLTVRRRTQMSYRRVADLPLHRFRPQPRCVTTPEYVSQVHTVNVPIFRRHKPSICCQRLGAALGPQPTRFSPVAVPSTRCPHLWSQETVCACLRPAMQRAHTCVGGRSIAFGCAKQRCMCVRDLQVDLQTGDPAQQLRAGLPHAPHS
jgi:hypothetical protein